MANLVQIVQTRVEYLQTLQASAARSTEEFQGDLQRAEHDILTVVGQTTSFTTPQATEALMRIMSSPFTADIRRTLIGALTTFQRSSTEAGRAAKVASYALAICLGCNDSCRNELTTSSMPASAMAS